MNTEEKSMLILNFVTYLIKTALKEPNSSKSLTVSSEMSRAVDIRIDSAELHRFNNAAVNDRILISFKEKRAFEIAHAVLKSELIRRREFPDAQMRKNISVASRNLKVSYADLLEVFRGLYMEIVNDALQPK